MVETRPRNQWGNAPHRQTGDGAPERNESSGAFLPAADL